MSRCPFFWAFKKMKSGVYCTSLEQINSRKLWNLFFKHISPINGPTMVIIRRPLRRRACEGTGTRSPASKHPASSHQPRGACDLHFGGRQFWPPFWRSRKIAKIGVLHKTSVLNEIPKFIMGIQFFCWRSSKIQNVCLDERVIDICVPTEILLCIFKDLYLSFGRFFPSFCWRF